MAQAEIKNHTRLACEVLYLNDESFRPLVVPVLKATIKIKNGEIARELAEQEPICLEGKYWGDPESSSYKLEPESCFIKNTTDVAVIGSARSSKGPLTHLLVEISVGTLSKRLGVIGNREWKKASFGYHISDITPFEEIPIKYENSFGGWDKRISDPKFHLFEPRNTVGKGLFNTKVVSNGIPMLLPNIEDPENQIRNIEDRPTPVGCGFTLPHWEPRVNYAGTYDDHWLENRSPILPQDFDRRFFSGASEGLIANAYFKGDEAVRITNMTPEGVLEFRLPDVKPLVCMLRLKDGDQELHTHLDTIIIDTENMIIQMIWRNHYVLQNGPHDLEAIDVHYG